jgi:predicted GIY-YIG superfamily endonuclease
MNGLPSVCFGVFDFHMARKVQVPLIDVVLGEGFKMIGKYVHSKTPIELECAKGHRFFITSNHFKRRKRCTICGNCGRMTNDIFAQKMEKFNNGIKAIGLIQNNSDKVDFICKNGHIFKTRPGILLRGYGCEICSGKRLTKEIVLQRLQPKGLVLVGDFNKVVDVRLFRCELGHTWEARVESLINSDKGCPHCAVTGFKPYLPATFYLFLLEKDGAAALGFGITNNFKRRMEAHNRSFKKSNTTATLIKTFLFQNGDDAKGLEKTLRDHPLRLNFGVIGFKRECLPLEMKEYILEKIESTVTQAAQIGA